MFFFTTIFINNLIKQEYLNFIDKHYTDILSNSNKYISLVENAISQYLGGGYVKLLNSGTTALQIGLLGLGVEKGDEVILPANTYSATAIVIKNIGATPVFCDINLDDYTIDIEDLEKKITNKTKAIIPVHIYGYPCNMDGIVGIANKHGLKILEDASHSFGGEYKGRKLGTIGNIGAYSCHVSKNFGTLGNGGIFFTKDKSIYEKIDKYIFPDTQDLEVLKSLRTPANIGVFDAIVLLIKIKYLDKIISYNINLFNQEYGKNKDFIYPKLNLKENKIHIRNLVVLAKNRDYYIENGFGKQYYDINLAQNGIFSDKIDLKNTQKFFAENIGLNFYFGMK